MINSMSFMLGVYVDFVLRKTHLLDLEPVCTHYLAQCVLFWIRCILSAQKAKIGCVVMYH